MSALKGRDIERFTARPDLDEGVVLVYGPDSGLVRETADLLVKHYSSSGTMGLVTLDGGELDADPGRLEVEARTGSLFGDKRVVRVRGGGKSISVPLASLLDDPGGAMVIVEAGNLTPRDPLRAQVEAGKSGRALPCYADSDEVITRLINETLSKAGIRADADVAPTLRDILGNDREVTRRELEKLSLFAAQTKTLGRSDVLTLCADNATTAIDEISDAIGGGRADMLEASLARALATSVDSQRILASVTQHFAALRRWRSLVDSGKPVSVALDSFWPKPHFSRRNSLEQQVRLWSDSALAAASERLLATTAESRKNYALAETIMRRNLLSLARQGAER
ncbi:MAG: DNA polymerase III subunit delta [Devosia sp.]